MYNYLNEISNPQRAGKTNKVNYSVHYTDYCIPQ